MCIFTFSILFNLLCMPASHNIFVRISYQQFRRLRVVFPSSPIRVFHSPHLFHLVRFLLFVGRVDQANARPAANANSDVVHAFIYKKSKYKMADNGREFDVRMLLYHQRQGKGMNCL